MFCQQLPQVTIALSVERRVHRATQNRQCHFRFTSAAYVEQAGRGTPGFWAGMCPSSVRAGVGSVIPWAAVFTTVRAEACWDYR